MNANTLRRLNWLWKNRHTHEDEDFPGQITEIHTVIERVIESGPGSGGGGAPTIVIAADSATSFSKAKADSGFQCSGAGDDIIFQSAVDQLPPGGRLLLTEGPDGFLFSGSVTIDKPLTIEGMGRDLTIIKATAGISNLFSLTSGNSVVSEALGGAEEVKFEKLTLDGNDFAGNCIANSTFGSTGGLVLDAIRVVNATGAGVLVGRTAGYLRVADSLIAENLQGINISESRLDVYDSSIIGNPTGIRFSFPASGGQIRDSLITASGDAIFNGNALGGAAGGVLVIDSEITAGGVGINSGHGNGWTIIGNVISATTGMVFGAGGFGSSTDHWITSNRFAGTTFITNNNSSGSVGVVFNNLINGAWQSSDPASSPIPNPNLNGFSRAGVLAVTAGQHKLVFQTAGIIQSVVAAVGTAPTGADVIVDLNKNGASIFTTPANRPTIAAGTTVSAEAIPDLTTIAEGDRLTVDIDQVGSSTPGDDLTVTVEWRPA